MNNNRRRKLYDAIDYLTLAKSNVEYVLMEEQISFDNLPDAFKDATKGDMVQACIGQLDDAIDNLDSAIESLNEAVV